MSAFTATKKSELVKSLSPPQHPPFTSNPAGGDATAGRDKNSNSGLLRTRRGEDRTASWTPSGISGEPRVSTDFAVLNFLTSSMLHSTECTPFHVCIFVVASRRGSLD